MKNKKCINCKRLRFIDWYICSINKNKEKDIYISNINKKIKCKYFKRSYEEFWLKGEIVNG